MSLRTPDSELEQASRVIDSFLVFYKYTQCQKSYSIGLFWQVWQINDILAVTLHQLGQHDEAVGIIEQTVCVLHISLKFTHILDHENVMAPYGFNMTSEL